MLKPTDQAQDRNSFPRSAVGVPMRTVMEFLRLEPWHGLFYSHLTFVLRLSLDRKTQEAQGNSRRCGDIKWNQLLAIRRRRYLGFGFNYER